MEGEGEKERKCKRTKCGTQGEKERENDWMQINREKEKHEGKEGKGVTKRK